MFVKNTTNTNSSVTEVSPHLTLLLATLSSPSLLPSPTLIISLFLSIVKRNDSIQHRVGILMRTQRGVNSSPHTSSNVHYCSSTERLCDVCVTVCLFRALDLVTARRKHGALRRNTNASGSGATVQCALVDRSGEEGCLPRHLLYLLSKSESKDIPLVTTKI